MRDFVGESVRAFLTLVIGGVLVVLGVIYVHTFIWYVNYPGEGVAVSQPVWLPETAVVVKDAPPMSGTVDRVELEAFQAKVSAPTVWVHESWDLFSLNYYGRVEGHSYLVTVPVLKYGLNHKLEEYDLDSVRGQGTFQLREWVVTESRWGLGILELFLISPAPLFLVGFPLWSLAVKLWPYRLMEYAYN